MAQSERWKVVKAWGPRGLHSGKVSPDQEGFKRIPLYGGVGNGQERKYSQCVYLHVRKVTQRDKQRLRGLRAASMTPNSLISSLGNPGQLTGVSGQEEEIVAKELLNTRTFPRRKLTR